jgi:hypothetical protein
MPLSMPVASPVRRRSGPALRPPRRPGIWVRNFDPDRRVIARPFAGPHIAIDAGSNQAAGKGWTQSIRSTPTGGRPLPGFG